MCNVCEGYRVLQATKTGTCETDWPDESATVDTGYYIARWPKAPRGAKDIHVQARNDTEGVGSSETGPMEYRMRLEGEDWPDWEPSEECPAGLMGWLKSDVGWRFVSKGVKAWVTGEGPKPVFACKS